MTPQDREIARLRADLGRLQALNTILRTAIRELQDVLKQVADARIDAQGPVVPRPHPDRRPTVQ